MKSQLLLSVVLLAPLLVAASPQPQITSRPLRRQDPGDTGDGTDDGTGNGDNGTPSSASPDTGDTTDAAASTAAASPSAPAASSAANIGTPLGGAGQGGGIPTACANCAPTYLNIINCLSDGSSTTCSPICSNYANAVSCISCLVANGEPDVDQDAGQQVVWNLESSCSSIGSPVSSLTITAVPTATGAMTTPTDAGTMTSAKGSKISISHSGITVYDSVKIKQTGLSTSPATNPTSATSGAGLRKISLPVSVSYIAGMGGITLLAFGLGNMVALW